MELVEVAPGVFRFEKRMASGWGSNMFVVRGLVDGGVVVHSPIWVDDAGCDAVAALGPVRALVMPNHFHHLSVPRYHARFPDAALLADARAIPRLARKTRLAIAKIDWPAWRAPDGLKNGEGWLSLPGDGGPTWIACDAFFNVTRPVRGLAGAFLRRMKTTPGLSLGRTFRWLAIADAAAYARWLLDALARERPRRLLVSHGEAVDGDDLPERLAALVRERIPEVRAT